MTNAYTERILSPGKKFYFTIHGFTSSQGSSRLVWSGPFIVRTVCPHSAMIIFESKSGEEFKVNGQKD